MTDLGRKVANTNLRKGLALGAVAALALLGGCSKKPGGQVVAVVGNEEITQQELRAEALTSPPPPGQSFEDVAPVLLQQVIERNLLADYARDQGFDRGPEYIARRRQLEQTLLASLAARQLAGPPKTPSDAEVRKFMTDNAVWFAGRERLTLDQLRFPTPADRGQIKTLTALDSIDAINARLRAQGVAVARARTVLDTGAIDPRVGKQIAVLPNGEIFDLSANGTTFISTIVDRAASPTPAAQATGAARAAMVRGQSGAKVGAKIAQLRKAAKISYEPAYRPQAN